ncbi:hypothetical protein DFJ74DRAFT_746831 [Hyaloraphidium curvatum]|nr:hypothetical protein DFJ74DRAFT_746831 [Hyaloraphidium curvatum]
MPGAAGRNAVGRRMRVVAGYHERTKHRLEGYAASPESVDWNTAPSPFRTFGGERALLPLLDDDASSKLPAAGSGVPAAPDVASVAALLELACGISAWKQYGDIPPWSLRCAPSSGNLHPTETYLLASGVAGLGDALYHYSPRDHALELRARKEQPRSGPAVPRIALGLTSIHWREAWKYGERAFRYCLLDLGHVVGSLRYAAAVLRWGLRIVEVPSVQLAKLLGVDREEYSGVEGEEPELLLEVVFPSSPHEGPLDWDWLTFTAGAQFFGKPTLLDPNPLYEWEVIDEVARATRFPGPGVPQAPGAATPPSVPFVPLAGNEHKMPQIIKQRRSAQDFNPNASMLPDVFYRLLDSLLPRDTPGIFPLDIITTPPRNHLLLFVHRVTGLAPGIYCLPRRKGIEPRLRMSLDPGFEWSPVAVCPRHIPLYRLLALPAASTAQLARTVFCHQEIAADCAVAVAMLAEFESPIAASPSAYRALHIEAGLLGHVLYLEAENLGLRGTGVGCFFDDAVHDAVGITGRAFQTVYAFMLGTGVDDRRILSLPAYGDRERL